MPVQPPSQLHPTNSSTNSKDKFMLFMSLDNSCTQRNDYLMLIIKTANAHRKMWSQTTFNTFKKCNEGDENTTEEESGGQCNCFTITKIKYLHSDYHLVPLLLYLYLWYKVH